MELVHLQPVYFKTINILPGHLAQSVLCLTADPGVSSLIPAWSHTSVEVDHETISMAVLLPSADSRRLLSVTSESMCQSTG